MLSINGSLHHQKICACMIAQNAVNLSRMRCCIRHTQLNLFVWEHCPVGTPHCFNLCLGLNASPLHLQTYLRSNKLILVLTGHKTFPQKAFMSVLEQVHSATKFSKSTPSKRHVQDCVFI